VLADQGNHFSYAATSGTPYLPAVGYFPAVFRAPWVLLMGLINRSVGDSHPAYNLSLLHLHAGDFFNVDVDAEGIPALFKSAAKIDLTSTLLGTKATKRSQLDRGMHVNQRVSTVEFRNMSFALGVCPPNIESVVPHAETKTPSKLWRCLVAVGEYTALGPYELIEKCELHELRGPADHLIGGMCRCW
jgi:hypothetical protein